MQVFHTENLVTHHTIPKLAVYIAESSSTLPSKQRASHFPQERTVAEHASPRLASTHAGKCSKWQPHDACNQMQMTRILASLKGFSSLGRQEAPPAAPAVQNTCAVQRIRNSTLKNQPKPGWPHGQLRVTAAPFVAASVCQTRLNHVGSSSHKHSCTAGTMSVSAQPR